jgi:transglutaminase superfamily protein
LTPERAADARELLGAGDATMKQAVRRRAYLREAALAFAVAGGAARILPVRRLLRLANKRPRRLSRFRNDEIAWIGWAAAVIALRTRVDRTSFPAALATQIMLRRRGIASRLCIGIEPQAAITNYAWVEVPDGPIVGEIDASRFVVSSSSAPRAPSAAVDT